MGYFPGKAPRLAKFTFCGYTLVVHTQLTFTLSIIVIPDPNEAANVPLLVPTGPDVCSKVQVMIGDLPKEAQTQSILRLHFQFLVGQVSSVELYGDIAIVTLETPTS